AQMSRESPTTVTIDLDGDAIALLLARARVAGFSLSARCRGLLGNASPHSAMPRLPSVTSSRTHSGIPAAGFPAGAEAFTRLPDRSSVRVCRLAERSIGFALRRASRKPK